MTLAQWIKKRRTDRGITQAGLATALNVSRSALSLWESGKTRPHKLRVEDLERHLGPMPASTQKRWV